MTDTRYYPEEDLYMSSKYIRGQKCNLFADQITWQLLDKKMPQNVALDIDTALLEGLYTGPTRVIIRIPYKLNLLQAV
jgi:hypothetical protein